MSHDQLCVEAKIDKTQQKSKCRLCGDRDKTINHIINKYSKSVQKENKTGRGRWSTRNWNFTIRTNGSCTTKNPSWGMRCIKFLWDFEIQTDHLISARKLDLITINRTKEMRICRKVDFAVSADNGVKIKENEMRDKYLNLVIELEKKVWNMKVTVIPVVIGALGMILKSLVRWLEELEIRGQSEIIETTALLGTARVLRRVLETWGDLRRLAVTTKDNQLMLRKTIS